MLEILITRSSPAFAAIAIASFILLALLYIFSILRKEWKERREIEYQSRIEYRRRDSQEG